jgi:hypothetical protein
MSNSKYCLMQTAQLVAEQGETVAHIDSNMIEA